LVALLAPALAVVGALLWLPPLRLWLAPALWLTPDPALCKRGAATAAANGGGAAAAAAAAAVVA
jgi:hypothetical protein